MYSRLFRYGIGALLVAMLIGCGKQAQKQEKVAPLAPQGAPFEQKAPEILQELLVLNKEIPHGMYDPVEVRQIRGEWQQPGAGKKLELPGGSQVQWETMRADSAGWFTHKALGHTYAYASVKSDREKVMLLEAMGHRMVYVNGEPRVGNRYQRRDEQNPWEPQYNYSRMPIRLQKGQNDLLFLCSRGRLKVTLRPMRSAVMLNVNDPTMPDAVASERMDDQGAVIVVNGTNRYRKDLELVSRGGIFHETATELPAIPPMTIRKVPFRFQGNMPDTTGNQRLELALRSKQKPASLLDTASLKVAVKKPGDARKETFISSIDSSLQYYAVNPPSTEAGEQALFLSVHGASVEAINQAGSYDSKSWAWIVAPTNRRPYGYDWEGWGAVDALEVLEIAKKQYPIDENRVYLTGHSMGGHGTWYLGVTYPDKWASIAPSAGWISFWTYVQDRMGQDARGPDAHYYSSLRPRNTFGLVSNLKANNGVYIIHGLDDQVVSADQAFQMMDTLDAHDIPYRFHGEPDAGHWWDHEGNPGAECVDWPPMFDYAARQRIPADAEKLHVHFVTANPGVSHEKYWLGIEQQQKQLALSKADITWEPGSRVFSGNTDNVARLHLKPGHVAAGDSLTLHIDGATPGKIAYPDGQDKIWLQAQEDGTWEVTGRPGLRGKGPHRYGTFKGAFQHKFMFVYGTQGSPEANQWAYQKARYDAETFWYQGNGSVEMVPDTTYSKAAYAGRDVIVYGNATNNAAWEDLLADCPVYISEGRWSMKQRRYEGEQFASVFMYPRSDNDTLSVGVVAATGAKGRRLLTRRKYMYPFTNAPDVTVFDANQIATKQTGVVGTGYFGTDWSVESGDFVWHSAVN